MIDNAKWRIGTRFYKNDIRLHIDAGKMGGGERIDEVTELSFIDIENGNDNDFYDFKWGNNWDDNGNGVLDSNEEGTLNGNNFDPDRFGFFHYCIFGHNYEEFPDSSGRAKFNDDDIFIADGVFPSTDKKVSSTFMHELGHNLDLHHYGDLDQCPHAPDHEGGKGCPDYISIMSYYYQLSPSKWPDDWDGYPNYGTHPGGWNDWEHLAIDEISDPGDR